MLPFVNRNNEDNLIIPKFETNFKASFPWVACELNYAYFSDIHSVFSLIGIEIDASGINLVCTSCNINLLRPCWVYPQCHRCYHDNVIQLPWFGTNKSHVIPIELLLFSQSSHFKLWLVWWWFYRLTEQLFVFSHEHLACCYLLTIIMKIT